MIFVNLKALLLFVLAGFSAVYLLCMGQVYAALFAPFVVAIAGDLLMRWFAAGECDRPLFNPEAGGQVFPIPVWCAAILLAAIFALRVFTGI